MITDPFFYLVAIPAVLIVGISKGGFGGGLGLVAVPLMALAVPPVQAAAILLPVLCAMDLFGLWSFRGTFDRINLRILLPAALLGITVGALSFHTLTESHIKLMTGAMAVIFSLNHFGQRLFAFETKTKKPSVILGSIWGAFAGFTSFSVHAGGPPINIYLLPQRLNKTVFVGTTIVFFAVVNYVKLIPYAWLGLLRVENLMTALALALIAPVGMLFGIYMHHRISDRYFYLLVYVLLTVTGIKLCIEGLAG